MGPFPQVFRQDEEWIILELHETIRVSLVVASVIVFILFCDWDGQGGVFKVMKKDHSSVFLAAWVYFPRFLGRLRSGLYRNCME